MKIIHEKAYLQLKLYVEIAHRIAKLRDLSRLNVVEPRRV